MCVLLNASASRGQETLGDQSFALSNHTISIGDELQLDFLDDQDNPFTLIVGDDGAVQLPFLGSFVLADEPISQAPA